MPIPQILKIKKNIITEKIGILDFLLAHKDDPDKAALHAFLSDPKNTEILQQRRHWWDPRTPASLQFFDEMQSLLAARAKPGNSL
ncbi:MAG: hypothetical protein Q8R79_01055 [Legionellaceae bacterium]|nr:hypothetical protein [Legionellaceae bacterium]